MRTETGSDTIPVMCCDTVNRGVAYADGKIFLRRRIRRSSRLITKTGRSLEGPERRSEEAETGTSAPTSSRTSHRRHQRRRIRRPRRRRPLTTSGRQQGVAGYSMDRIRHAVGAISTSMSKPVGADSGTATRDQWKIGAAPPGWYSLIRLNLFYYGRATPAPEPGAAAGRQQMVDDDLCARSRHQQGRGSAR
jgi:hypothetical protein